jgi:hypothetical protein
MKGAPGLPGTCSSTEFYPISLPIRRFYFLTPCLTKSHQNPMTAFYVALALFSFVLIIRFGLFSF